MNGEELGGDRRPATLRPAALAWLPEEEEGGSSEEQEDRDEIESQLSHRFIRSINRAFSSRMRSVTKREFRS